MTAEDGYGRMVAFLAKYFFRTKLHDLAPLLGSMDPSLWTNKKPIDPSMTRDWNRITCGNNLSEVQCLDAIRQFVKMQQEEFKYDLNQLISDMDNFTDEHLRRDWEEVLHE